MGSDEVRCSLLDHYSSQTQAHANELLTLALVGFGFVQFEPQLSVLKTIALPILVIHLDKLVLFVVAGLLSSLGIRTTLRTFYWGYLSSSILSVPRQKGVDSLQNFASDWDDKNLETNILHQAAMARVKAQHPSIHKWAQDRGWFTWVLVAVAMASLIFLTV
jgi:hypothetical protein